MRTHGEVLAVGVEGTGPCGSELARFLRANEVTVVDVDRPDRKARRANGKSDPVDTYAAATAILSGRANGLYLHGADWVFGNAHTHDRLVRELAVGTGAAVVFPEYDLSPEARYPVAVEQNYAVARWVVEQGAAKGLDATRIAVAGDSVGGNMTAALTLMAKERGDVPLVQQVLFYPVTDASFDTGSYHQFATGYFLRRDAMQWFWDQYTTDEKQRAEITASPLRASVDQLRDLPPALIITAEADVLRDEGEAYANRLREAGVPVTAVRYQGVIHDFVMLNALRETHAAEAAIAQAISTLRTAFATA
ncbi:alpha/beta hydrolase fold domain-containing protein [Streptomyces sp. NPDC003015]